VLSSSFCVVSGRGDNESPRRSVREKASGRHLRPDDHGMDAWWVRPAQSHRVYNCNKEKILKKRIQSSTTRELDADQQK
jgi:hypothetical protein